MKENYKFQVIYGDGIGFSHWSSKITVLATGIADAVAVASQQIDVEGQYTVYQVTREGYSGEEMMTEIEPLTDNELETFRPDANAAPFQRRVWATIDALKAELEAVKKERDELDKESDDWERERGSLKARIERLTQGPDQ